MHYDRHGSVIRQDRTCILALYIDSDHHKEGANDDNVKIHSFDSSKNMVLDAFTCTEVSNPNAIDHKNKRNHIVQLSSARSWRNLVVRDCELGYCGKRKSYRVVMSEQ